VDSTLAILERTYRAQFSAFLRTATAYLGDPEAAWDAVQEGVATAIRKRRSYRGEGPIEAWLWRVVLNSIRTQYRERRRAPWFVDLPEDREAVAETGGESTTDAVRALVRALPERQRLVLFLRYYADLDYATIAAVAEITEGAVGASLHAAHTKLRAVLEEVRV
jgi:RNA polymerase sigma-70 factor (ECF subfamily)